MLLLTTGKRKAFEAAVYNKDVRAAVKDNKSHDFFSDFWADLQLQDVLASDETEARRLIDQRYPAERGFVVGDLVPSQP
ncbi:MAG: hypothetical protein QGF71_00465 [Rhodospirillales bacterium]|nr:hypothetical protein [Rhodospirillales bacterium]